MPLTDFASRQPATFIRGTVFTEDIRSSARMLEVANLANWDVRQRVLDSDARRTTETFEVIRTNPHDGGIDRLGVSGERYTILQNEEAFAPLDALDSPYEAAGSFRGGSVVYGQLAVDRTIVIDPNGAADEVKPFVIVHTTHDGSGAATFGRVAMRLKCFNMMNMMLRDVTQAVKIRHTVSMQDRVRAVTLAWKESNAYFDALSAEANALYQKSVTDKQFFGIVENLIGERPDTNKKGAQTKYDGNLEMYAQAWRGRTTENIAGTGWGAFQAILERIEHGRKVQDTPNGLDNFAMAGMGLDTPTNTARAKALELVKAL